ncbi:MAG: tRNA pseudouridine(38-40) synthase TruA [Planctomycetota bacterium]
MSVIALGVEYAGQAFAGWQRQANVATVQGALEAALSRVADRAVTVNAAGRTDRGVHATAQVASFEIDVDRPLKAWRFGANAHLPDGVSVVWAQEMDAGFHARFSAVARRYLYVWLGEPPGALAGAQAWACGTALDPAAMDRAAQVLLGEQDFSAVRAAGCQSPTPVRCVHRVRVQRRGDLIVLDIEANAFLLHMVRNIASALQQIGAGRRDADWLTELLAGRDRAPLGPTAPPQGLYLVEVRYPETCAVPPGRLPPLLRTLDGLSAL